MHMCGMLAGTQRVERGQAAYAAADAPLVACNFTVGSPFSDCIKSARHPGRRKGAIQKHLWGATLDSYLVTMETHPWKLPQFQENSYKQ